MNYRELIKKLKSLGCKSPPHMGELEQQFVRDAFDSNYIAPVGPQVDAFEKEFSEYTGIRHCVALSSGTAAMHLALKELGVGPGDEVIGSTLTFVGSISPVIFLGVSVVLVDCDHLWRGQLTVLDDRVQQRREIFEYYRQALKDVPGIEFMPEADYGTPNRWLTVILITPEQFGADMLSGVCSLLSLLEGGGVWPFFWCGCADADRGADFRPVPCPGASRPVGVSGRYT